MISCYSSMNGCPAACSCFVHAACNISGVGVWTILSPLHWMTAPAMTMMYLQSLSPNIAWVCAHYWSRSCVRAHRRAQCSPQLATDNSNATCSLLGLYTPLRWEISRELTDSMLLILCNVRCVFIVFMRDLVANMSSGGAYMRLFCNGAQEDCPSAQIRISLSTRRART